MADIKAGRAAQFAPFAALEGYGGEIDDIAALYGDKRSPVRRDDEELSVIMRSLKKYDSVKVVFSGENGIEEMHGTVIFNDMAYRVLELSDIRIPFDDILHIAVE